MKVIVEVRLYTVPWMENSYQRKVNYNVCSDKYVVYTSLDMDYERYPSTVK